ncbi:tripartite motif-containing protein 59-like [Ruditapes philippinarum]|uniref:tripartite motif-containing protein 59-like n=1 Tax=Ruditapes philippinarum TaxID=129788 RepID=UPI00295AA371|nr:tripartite motif-containing protein 59-like [Ruditapes philippinarum]
MFIVFCTFCSDFNFDSGLIRVFFGILKFHYFEHLTDICRYCLTFKAALVIPLNMPKTIKEIIMEDFLTCSICMGEFKDPKVLICLHTFCEECICTTIQHQLRTSRRRRISCPTCRTVMTIDLNSDDYNLLTNFPVKNLLEMIKVNEQLFS